MAGFQRLTVLNTEHSQGGHGGQDDHYRSQNSHTHQSSSSSERPGMRSQLFVNLPPQL